jgi:hypothetical protein
MTHRHFIRISDINVGVLDIGPNVCSTTRRIHCNPSPFTNINRGRWVSRNMVNDSLATVCSIRLVTPIVSKNYDVGVPILSTVGLGNLHVHRGIVLEINSLSTGIITTSHRNVEIGSHHIYSSAIFHGKRIGRLITPVRLVH